MKNLLLLVGAILILTFGISARSITDHGAIASDGLSDAEAVLATLRAVEDDCGGEVVVPRGEFLIDEPIITDFYGGCGWIHITLRGEVGAVLRVTVGSANAFTFTSLKSLQVRDITFLGKPVPGTHPDFIDADSLFLISTVETAKFDHIDVYGLAVSTAMIRVFNSFLIVSNSKFLGDSAPYPNGTYILGDRDDYGNGWQGIKVENCKFLDYSNFKFDFISKTSEAMSGSYIKTVQPPSGAHAVTRGMLEVRSTSFDEGAHTAIDAKDTPYVVIDDIGINLNATSDATGIRLTNVKSAEITRSVADWQPGWFITTLNVERIKVELLEMRAGAHFWKNLGSTYMVQGWCPGCNP